MELIVQHTNVVEAAVARPPLFVKTLDTGIVKKAVSH